MGLLYLTFTFTTAKTFVDGFPSQRTVFSLKVDSVGFVVNRQALGQHDSAS